MQVITTWTSGHADALRRAMHMTNEGFADHLGVSTRQVANWRKRPDITQQANVQRILDDALENAPERVKAKFAILIGEERGAQSSNDPENNDEPSEIDTPTQPGSSILVLPNFPQSTESPAGLQQATPGGVVDVLSRIQRLRRGIVHPEIIGQLERNIQDK